MVKRKLNLQKVAKTTKKSKIEFVDKVRKCIDEFSHIIHFTVCNMRGFPLKEVREYLSDCKIFYTNNRLLQVALGRGEDTEYSTGLSLIANKLHYEAGLIFTNRVTEVLSYLQHYTYTDYPKSGFISTINFSLPSGIIQSMAHSLEPRLRQLGLKTKLQNGQILLEDDTLICSIGQKLNKQQCEILKLFDKKISIFSITAHYSWSKQSGQVQEINPISNSEIESKE